MAFTSLSLLWWKPLFLILITAIPMAFIMWLEFGNPGGDMYRYQSKGWLRECAKWDDTGRRFLVSSMEGGVSQVSLHHHPLKELLLVKDADLTGNSSLGLAIDRPRNRVLVVIADVLRNRNSALVAYHLYTWKRLFLAQLNAPGERTLADDVAVDPTTGTAYVTDAQNDRLWKVGVNGEVIGVITTPTKKCYACNFLGLNGIVYHPGGFLLVVHTLSGDLFRIPTSTTVGNQKNDSSEVELVDMGESGGDGSLLMGDGMQLLSSTELVVAGSYPSARLVESSDGWKTGHVVGSFTGPLHRVATSATVKDGKVLVSHLIGPKEHVIVEAVFRN